MTRLLNAEPDGYSDEANRILGSFAEVIAQPLDRAGLLATIPDVDALIVRLRFRVDDEVLEAGKQLRVVASATTGLDHIDLAAAASRGIEVISLRGERDFLDGIHATAEHTWALLLSLVRRVPWASASVLEGEWERDRFRGHELFGKRLGIVGLGRVGTQVAQFGRAFGMTIAAFDVTEEPLPADVERCASLGDLLEASDVVALHVPLNDATFGMIGEAELALMRPAAVLVNTSRGELVDEDALVVALESHQIAGAALDVVNNERSVPAESKLVAYAPVCDNLLVTPHIAGATYESMEKCEVFVANRLAEFFRGDAR